MRQAAHEHDERPVVGQQAGPGRPRRPVRQERDTAQGAQVVLLLDVGGAAGHHAHHTQHQRGHLARSLVLPRLEEGRRGVHTGGGAEHRVDRGRRHPHRRHRRRHGHVVQRLEQGASIPRPPVQDRLGPEDQRAARRPNRPAARQGDPRRRHLPDLLRPHHTRRRPRPRVQRSQDRRVESHRRDGPHQEERRPARALLRHARHGGQRQDARHRRRRQLADRHHHDPARRHQSRRRGRKQEERQSAQEQRERYI